MKPRGIVYRFISGLSLAVAIGFIMAMNVRGDTEDSPGRVELGTLSGGEKVFAVHGELGWGIRVDADHAAAAAQTRPVRFEFHEVAGEREFLERGYDSVRIEEGTLIGGTEAAIGDAVFRVEDRWRIVGATLALAREVDVSGEEAGGFASMLTLNLTQPRRWEEVTGFIPGIFYYDSEHLPSYAIGSNSRYVPGEYDLFVREDRLPAPMIGVLLDGRVSITVLNPSPDGLTSMRDARELGGAPLIDADVRVGSVGIREREGSMRVGYRFPSMEGLRSYTVRRNHQEPQWQKRFHPIRDGAAQRYQVKFLFGEHESYAGYVDAAWRWAWEELAPEVETYDMEIVREAITGVLEDAVISYEEAGTTGIINAMLLPDLTGKLDMSVMGFCGAAMEAATALMIEGQRDGSPRGAQRVGKGKAIIDSLARLPMSPPAGEGIVISTGEPVLAFPGTGVIFSRSLGDGLKYLLRFCLRYDRGEESRVEWIEWARSLGDWLLTQQTEAGGVPRAWEPGTGQVTMAHTGSTFNVIEPFVLLAEATGEEKYLEAAVRAGEYAWESGHGKGQFTGGTIDNPNVLDKEAVIIALEAYLSLHEATGDQKWLDRAEVAGLFGATWIYIWNVRMPEAISEVSTWDASASTIGMQLIATGHSGADAFMAYQAGAYARLHELTGDAFYREVGNVLLNGTKSILALPGRTFDLPAPGYQQEHWTFAPARGDGAAVHWLPWVGASHLWGIYEFESAAPDLFRELTGTK